MTAINIGWLELFFATFFIIVAGAVSIAMSLGMIRCLAIAIL